jgi:DUF1365 family protein
MNSVYGVCLFGFVAMGLRAAWVFKIHWQAIKLWLKGAKFYKKPNPPEIKTS